MPLIVATGNVAWRVQLRARVTQEIRPDCVFMLHGYGKRSPWLKNAYRRGGSDAVLIEAAWDRASGNAAMHETFVKVAKAAGGTDV